LWRQNFRTDLLVFVTLLISAQAPSVTSESVTNYQHLHYRTLRSFIIISIMCVSNCHWPQLLLLNCSTLSSVFLFKISFRTSKLLINMLIRLWFLPFTLSSFLSFLLWPLLPTHRSVEGYCYICRHSNTLHTVRLPWTKDRPIAEASTCTTHNIHKRQTSMSPARDSNPQSQQASWRRRTLKIPRPPGWSSFEFTYSTWTTQINFITIKSTETSHFRNPLFRSNICNLSTLRLSRCLLYHLIRSISASLVSRTRILSIPFATNRLIYPQQPATATTVLSHCLPS
jgi:hypothetical protein